MSETVQQRNEQLRASIQRHAQNEPYDNLRPINVPGRFDGHTLIQCLVAMHPHIGDKQWRDWFARGQILSGERPVRPGTIVRGGNQFQHLFPNWVEPPVDAGIEILWEDESIIAVNKPAPLPVHPCGRFNRNTLTWLMGTLYTKDDLRVVHRLDSNTTGVLLLARTRRDATALRNQFESNQIRKTYAVRAIGHPDDEIFVSDQPISRRRGPAGLRTIDADGDHARTRFTVVRRQTDGTSILVARPETGRTHQIRIHLWALGIPVLGDPAYLPNGQLGATQTRSIDDQPMCLHAAELQFHHPTTGQEITITSPDPNWYSAHSEIGGRSNRRRESAT